MKLNDMVKQPGEWLRADGPEADIVISSRVRIARNLTNYPFARKMDDVQREALKNEAVDTLLDVQREGAYFDLVDANTVERQVLVERHLISRELANADGPRGAWVSGDESMSIMINEEDHLRIQFIRSGLQLEDSLGAADRLDDQLEEQLLYAFSPEFGYLTACPTNTGTGLRISVMVHIPALVIGNQMQMVLKNLSRINCAVRGLFGEGTHASGDFYQISNQVTLGKSEEDLVGEMQGIIREIVSLERDFRKQFQADQPDQLKDRVGRAHGILSTSHIISSEETLQLLSALRLGCHLGLIDSVDIDTLNRIFLSTQPGHLQMEAGRELEPEERDVLRAEYIRTHLKN
jgi:protein arginine kinase